MMKKFVLAGLVWALGIASAHAGLIIDFSLGPVGNLGTPSTTQGNVKVDAFGGNLYRHNGYECCNHIDRGIGVLGWFENDNPAESELNGVEYIRLTRPANHTWDKIYFSSVNNKAYGAVYANIYPVGPETATFKAGEGAFLNSDEGFITIDGAARLAPYLWIHALIPPQDNFFLLWKLDLHKGENLPDPVPEPTSLTMLGIGLILGVRRMRRGSITV